jgi:rare lipoprotein A
MRIRMRAVIHTDLLASFVAALLAAGGCRKADQPVAPDAAVEERVVSVRRGVASQYSAQLAGRRTASGGVYRPDQLTAAHRSLPFGTRVRVTRLAGQDRDGARPSVIVRIDDRGPYGEGRLIDLSEAAARRLDMVGDIARVQIEVLADPPR